MTRIGSFCTGYAGLDMAVQQVLGGNLTWVADNDPGAQKILAHHHPGTPNLGDITALNWDDVPAVDIIAVGFPCQDISYAGRGEGIKEGNRSGLWHTIADAVRVLRPRLLLLENVAGIVVRRPGLDVVLADLAALGFDAEWTTVRASDVGAPHRRERWFCLAWPAEDADRAVGGERRLAASGQAAGGRARADTGRSGGTPAADTDGEARRLHIPISGPSPLQGAEVIERAPQQPGRLRSGSADGSALAWAQFEPAIRRWEATLGRPAHRPTEPRRTADRLSPRFVEWMMGLPDGHVTAVPGLTYNQQLKALGNGVVPQQAAHALRILLDRAGRQAAA